MKKYFIITAVALSVFAYGQDYAFRVLANKGANEVKTPGGWQAVKTGISLKQGDELKISENSYLGLVHNTGKPVELKKAGAYKIADLEKDIASGSSVLNKYTDFILSSNSAEAKKNRLSATGAVHRGMESVKIQLPENQHAAVFNHIVIINWQSKAAGPYVVKFKNMFDDELMKVETPETSYQVDLNDPKFANESEVLVEVMAKTDAKSKSEAHLIKRMSANERAKITKTLAELPDINNDSAFSKYLLAGFYEQNKLLIDAITAYEQAIALAPDVPTFQESYEEFLLRNKLKEME